MADPADFDDDQLEAAIAQQKDTIASFEADYLPMRATYERLRVRLRALEGEVQRRRLAAQGVVKAATRPRRSTLISDILAGREILDPALRGQLLSEFRFLSLSRQDILLNREGDRVNQVIGFVTADKQARQAHTFQEALALISQGLTPGVPGVPLQRQGVYLIGDQKPSWLRVDQIFVEPPA